MIDNSDYEEIICPHCFGYFIYDKSDDEMICTNCNRIITEEDLENVFTEDPADISSETISA